MMMWRYLDEKRTPTSVNVLVVYIFGQLLCRKKTKVTAFSDNEAQLVAKLYMMMMMMMMMMMYNEVRLKYKYIFQSKPQYGLTCVANSQN